MNRTFIKRGLLAFSITSAIWIIVSLTGFVSVRMALLLGLTSSVIVGISEYRKNKKGDD
ncbi:MAG: hypothetical protein GX857_01535 [Bacteroidales bacterium]|jgi:hypothetical protein|nr:hypothetical protein [Bacteroidales bacterium]